ncbi:MAG: hypothetical protein M1834_001300 [Cirrosporium novae-zelandiae]|nr:MAG: hypothetical protein M1834_001300 [Cirrosporium novae-zelandiae]
MVHIQKGSPPSILYAYLTSPQPLQVLDQVHHDFAIGSFARFDPSVELFICDRPEFYGKPHVEIRQKLDEEGLQDAFLVIEDRTTDSNAVWYIERTSHAESASEDDEFVKHGNEPPLLRLRIKTRDVPLTHVNYEIANTDIVEDIEDWPFDSHADQEPWTLGVDFEADLSWVPDAYITAPPDEVETVTDMEQRKNFLTGGKHPDSVSRVKPEVAQEAGLISRFAAGSLNADGLWHLQAKYDTESEKWKTYVPLQH